MACGSEQQRVGCALGGIYTVLAMKDVLPVLHAGPGCQLQSGTVLGKLNGAQNAVPYMETIIPCTDFCESDVVFGGIERLKKNVKKAMEYYKADMILVADGCTAEIVGDDIDDVVAEYEDSEIPVIAAKLPGFKGNNVWGHSQVINAIIDQLLEESDEKIEGLVNVWGIVPFYDTTWQGTLEAIDKLLRAVGLTPNIFYGHGKGVEELKKIPKAQFNLLLSPWVDVQAVKKLERKFGTPFFQYPNVPIGPTETKKFLEELRDYANLDPKLVDDYIKAEEDRYYYYISRQLACINEGAGHAKDFYVISSASVAVPLVRYLVNDLGMIPQGVYLVEDVPEKYQAKVEEYIRDIQLEDVSFPVVFTNDGGYPAQEILKNPVKESIILGSDWDRILARDAGTLFMPVSVPSGPRLIGQKSYFGFRGGVELFTDIMSALCNA